MEDLRGETCHTAGYGHRAVPVRRQNSVLFQAVRKISLTLAYSLMFREICKLMGSTVLLTMRRPVHAEELSALGNRKAVTQFLRDRTYGVV
ncbi:MAG: hypothetical protein CM15mP60_2100 [Alphaproteobacteria bacterium]|nr:MAG: hypothetical protein CM15mP60_2100 [Alphaproteobacteria bacterium]